MIECLYVIAALMIGLPLVGGVVFVTVLWPLDYLWRWFTAHGVPDWLQLTATFAIIGMYLGVIVCILHTVIGE